MFPDFKQDKKKPVPNAGTELGLGRGCSQMLETGNFPDFWGKNPVPGNGIQEPRPLIKKSEVLLSKNSYHEGFFLGTF